MLFYWILRILKKISTYYTSLCDIARIRYVFFDVFISKYITQLNFFPTAPIFHFYNKFSIDFSLNVVKVWKRYCWYCFHNFINKRWKAAYTKQSNYHKISKTNLSKLKVNKSDHDALKFVPMFYKNIYYCIAYK